jgi:hypothetical protein
VDNSIGIAELATLLTAAGVAIYVLGMIGLALSIRLTFTQRLSTAWYAVSLMPKTVVAGQGMRIWRKGMLSVLIVALMLALGVGLGTFINPTVGFIVGTLAVVIVLGLYLAARADPPRMPGPTAVDADRNEPPRPLSRITVIMLMLVGSAGIGGRSWVAFHALQMTVNGRDLTLRAPRAPVCALQDIIGSFQITPNWDNLAVGVLILLVGAFLLGIPLSRSVEPPLPWVVLLTAVKLTDSKEAEPNKRHEVVKGWLVANTGGYWHLFDREHQLVSIPDGSVSAAQVQDTPRTNASLEA